MKDEFLDLVGEVPRDSDDFIGRFRIHQGWWRTAVLLEAPGPHPSIKGKNICNTIHPCAENKAKNFLSPSVSEVVQDEIDARKRCKSPGIIQEPRIWNNLLSSQPLCFNFWAPLKCDSSLSDKVLEQLVPGFSETVDIRFEWAPTPREDYTNDNSAFDIAIEYRNKKGDTEILGLECKYTDTFSKERYDTEVYRNIYNASKEAFAEEYDFYLSPDFNQLFRNKLIACSYEQQRNVKVRCGIFCSGNDEKALAIAHNFRKALRSEEDFIVLTYEHFIEAIQTSDIGWETRKWSMMLWARYIGLGLSAETHKAYHAK